MIELVVDDAALADRIVKRAEEAQAAGQPARRDDTPEVFDDRLRAYYKQTAPLLGYYHAKGYCAAVDGMAAWGRGRPDRGDPGHMTLACVGQRLRCDFTPGRGTWGQLLIWMV